MRSTVKTYLQNNTVSGFGVSDQLPFTQNGTALYLQNLKTIYVDQPTTEQEPLYDTLDDSAIVTETTTVDVYVATDAKTLPSNYDTLVSTVKNVRTDSTVQGYHAKEINVITSIENSDVLLTQFECKFTKVINN
jgi:hypothetical protein